MSKLNSRLQLALLNHKKAKKLTDKGFTLIELLITVVILGVLSSVAVPGFISQKNKADAQAANAQGRALMAACKARLSDNNYVISDTIYNASSPAKTFGNITWTPVFTAPTTPGTGACSSTTSGASTNQNFVLDMGTGDMGTDQPAA